MTIYFYSIREVPYGCFSNFSKHGVLLDGYWWPTTEHSFHAQKFVDTAPDWAGKIHDVVMPKMAAKMGRDLKHPLRSDWEQVKDDVMHLAVLAKFQNHADLQVILLNTGEQAIVENSPIDYYWGCGQDDSGQNKLGQILEAVRSTLRHGSVA